MSWQSQGIALLAASLVRPFALVVGAWIFIRAFRVRHPSSQHAVWTAVLLGMLLLPAVSALTPHWNLPLLPHHTATVAAVDLQNANSVPSDLQGGQAPYAATAPPAKPAVGFNLPTAGTMILAGYFVGLLAMAIYWAVGWVLLSRLVVRSRLLRAPRLRESVDVASPVTAGVLRPTVILPVGWRTWDANVRRAVLAHEFAHIRRHDSLALTLSRLVECVFWFHPLAWWLSRKTTELAELACDATVLEKTNDPGGYSRTLIEFAEAVSRAGHRTALPRLAMARPGSDLGQRIDQLFELSRKPMRKLSRPGLLLAAIGVPVLCLAATGGLREISTPSYRAGSAALMAQSPPTQFEAVSIKEVPPNVPSSIGVGLFGVGLLDPSEWRARAQPLLFIVMDAYGVGDYDRSLIVGLPRWAYTDSLDIVARVPAHSRAAQIPLMVRTMLADRFKLKAHWEARPMQAVAMTIAPGGPKMRRDTACENSDRLLDLDLNPLLSGDRAAVLAASKKPGGCGSWTRSLVNGMSVSVYHGFTMQQLADNSNAPTLPVLDRTQLAGAYDFTISVPWIEQLDDRKFQMLHDREQAYRKQLGLNIGYSKPVKLPVPVLVIDHLARASAN